MTIEQLAKEYEEQYKIVCAKAEGLRPLLYVYSGNDLFLLRKRIRIYYEMASECRCVVNLLSEYYEEEKND